MSSTIRKSLIEAADSSPTLSISSLITDPIMNLRIVSVRIQVTTEAMQPSAGLALDIMRGAFGQGILARPPAHFRLFFQLDRLFSLVEHSIEVNSTLEGAPRDSTDDDRNGKKTILKISYRDYGSSNGASRTSGLIDYISGDIPIRSSPRNPAEVGRLIDLLLHRGRHRYRLDVASGSGCRFFLARVLRDCHEVGWLDEKYLGIVESITSSLKSNRAWQHADLPFPAPQGKFY